MGRTEKKTPHGRRLWECDECERLAPWDKHWVWYGSIRELDDSVDVPVFCSRACVEHRLEESEAYSRAAMVGSLDEYDKETAKETP